MSLSADGFWKAGFWSTTFWANGFWDEDAIPASNVHPGLPVRVRSSRHRKPNTFRTELERLVYGEKIVAEAQQEAIIAQEVALLVERFNIIQTLQNNQAIQEQMALLSQDVTQTNMLLAKITEARQIEAQNEEVILMLVAGEL